MVELTPEQEDRLAELRESRLDRIESAKNSIEEGLTGHKLALVYGEIAGYQQRLGIADVYRGTISEAREWFGSSAETYGKSIEAALNCEPFATQYRVTPKKARKGLYTSVLAGDHDQMTTLAAQAHGLPDPTNWPDDPRSGPQPEIYALAQLLADITVGEIDHDHYRDAQERFADKTDPLSVSVKALLRFADGLDTDDTAALETGVEQMLTYHERDSHEDNVFDLVMAPEATALVILARLQGHDIASESEFVPMNLVTTVS